MTDHPATWPETCPIIRTTLGDLITANRTATRPRRPATRTTDGPRLRSLLRDLDQIDQNTTTTTWNSFDAYRLVRDVLAAIPLGHPAAGAIHRLAADLADQNNAARDAITAHLDGTAPEGNGRA